MHVSQSRYRLKKTVTLSYSHSWYDTRKKEMRKDFNRTIVYNRMHPSNNMQITNDNLQLTKKHRYPVATAGASMIQL